MVVSFLHVIRTSLEVIEMSESSLTTSKEPVSTKFSDLVGYLQILQTRISLGLAIIALMVSASASVTSVLPFLRPPPGSLPIHLYLAAFALTYGAFSALIVLITPFELQQKISHRLSSRELPSVDFVDPELHKAFIAE